MLNLDERYAFLRRITAELGEHFDAVQILVSWNEEGNSELLTFGCGNWYARQGMAHDFITRDQAQTQAAELAEQLPNPPPPSADDGEEWKQPH
jgi:hypothetical protein